MCRCCLFAKEKKGNVAIVNDIDGVLGHRGHVALGWVDAVDLEMCWSGCAEQRQEGWRVLVVISD